MSTVKINKFSGGLAEDIREAKVDTFSYASGFDTFSNAHKLTPYRTMLQKVLHHHSIIKTRTILL